MNLNNLKPAWNRLKLYNSFPALERIEVLQIIESREKIIHFRMQRMLGNSIVFLILLIGCHGG